MEGRKSFLKLINFKAGYQSLQAKNLKHNELGQPVDPSSLLCLWGFPADLEAALRAQDLIL